MTIHVRLFASLRERTGIDHLQVSEAFEPATVAGLKAHLCVINPMFAEALKDVGRLRAAVNHDMAEDDTIVPPAAEVAFFPPVTGG
ncbi:molybdopterin converting factor subunit 1 [Limnobacter humi]|uniref:Molybdopterin converting factor subunit 1 n=1 Tax=Limnobacter humi TaxID=1778671 RepID=A0ABT1WHZ9_9BURK|nr:molybdopterin converting factor subunit 1 [Limnobacter humi]MCQ8897147.1 molybdopterin converting factor subunit 1 [Limnobacter humi]